MAAELPRPGVEVIQVFQTVTPTVITPTLVPCIVGVCRQVVDVLVASATGAQTLNPQALVALQAIALSIAGTGSPPVYAGLNALNLDLSLNNGPAVSIDFSGTPLSPAQIVAQVLLAFAAAGVTSFTAETVNSGTQWRIRSVAANALQTIEVLSTTAPAVLAAFGFGVNKVYSGSVGYDQHITNISFASYPNPNNNLSQLVVDPTTVHAFLFLGGQGSALMELLQTEAFLENGIGTAATVTGSVDMTTLTYATPANHTGTTDVTASGLYGAGGTLAGGGTGLTLILNVNGAGSTTLTFDGAGLTNDASEAAMLAAINTQWPTLTATVVATHLVLTDNTIGASGSIVVGSGTANTALGLTATTYNGTAGTLDGETLILTFNGAASPLTVTFAPALTMAATVAQVTAVVAAVATAISTSVGNHLQITDLTVGATGSILVGAGTANAHLGVAPGTTTGIAGVVAIDSGSGAATTPLLQFQGANFTASPTSAQIVGTIAVPGGGVPNGQTLTLDDGNEPQTVTFESATTPSLVLAQINALFGAVAGGLLLASLSGSDLALTNTTLGQQSIVKVVGGTACPTLGLTAGTVSRGNPFAPLPGDVLWVDGVNFATIVQVAPGGNTNQLKINRQVPISTNVGLAWYIMAENLNADAPSAGVTRPFPNLDVDSSGNIKTLPEILRNTQGTPVLPSNAQIYVAYHALRLDVTSKAASPGLLRFSDTATLSAQLSPVDTDNPLALGIYFALLNAPNTQVTGLGVDESSGGSPFGTVAGFTRAASFLEAFEVYGIAPLTHDPSVSQVFQTHVDTMSAPENKGERIVLINPSVPTHYLDTLVASGINGNSTITTNVFDTGVANLGALLLANGESGVGPYAVTAGIFLDIGDGNHYSIINVVGSVVTVQTSGFLPGQNDDGYYATSALPSPLIAEPFAVRIRGKALVLPDGVTPDRDNIAITVQKVAQGYQDRRVWSTFPDTCAATLQGVEQVIDGFYLNSAIVGLIANQPPQQSFTNFPMTGFTRVIGSNGVFSEPQLNVMAAGGNYVIVQDAPATPLISRMALTTDMTSIETRTDSITKVVDFCAKFLRTGLKTFIGRFNITQGFLDSLGHVIHGLLGFLAEAGVLIGSNLNNIIQDVSAPDTVLIDVTLDVPFPCNYIRLTLTI
jgi:hypothetical protein